WVDYAAELGVDTLSLGPVFASRTHGYDTLDHFQIDARLGTEAEFGQFIATAHDHGLRVLVDGVFNHVSSEHPLFRRALQLDPDASGYFRWVDGHPQVFEGHDDLIALNHDAPCVAALVQDVLRHWMRLGVDGWRLDAAYATGADFWARVLPDVRAEFPGSYFFGEVIHGDYVDFVKRSGVDSVTQYELWKAIWSSIHDRNFFELSWAMKRHATLLDSFAPVTFIGNHDVTRIASQVGQSGAAVALAILMTVGGSPHIYYGDEQGFVGLKEERFGGDDAIRPAFPHTPGDLAPTGWWLFGLHQELIRMRRDRPWLARAACVAEVVENTRLTYRAERADDPGTYIRVALDLTDASHLSVRITDGGNAGLVTYQG
ncbi:MAG: alpha-amylase family glycosyl hydrolase, partial [Micrococcales bacterium]|nr:alpha-amylase family glycosyl hydrolase [Micrococcales bacterium]